MKERFELFVSYISELNRCIQKIKDTEMKKLGLKAGHTWCLYFLGKSPKGLTSSELTKKCKEDKAAISRTLGELIKAGLVVSDEAQGKRSYRTLHHLTAKGKEIVQKINKKIDAVLFQSSNGLTPSERKSLYSTMDTILNNLKTYQQESEAK